MTDVLQTPPFVHSESVEIERYGRPPRSRVVVRKLLTFTFKNSRFMCLRNPLLEWLDHLSYVSVNHSRRSLRWCLKMSPPFVHGGGFLYKLCWSLVSKIFLLHLSRDLFVYFLSFWRKKFSVIHSSVVTDADHAV